MDAYSNRIRVAKFCTEEKLKKRTSDRLIGMIKTRAFVIEDIRADSIREIEKMISDSCRSKITEHDLWREIDGVQDVKVYLSPLFMLNVHMWQFGRPQPRTISVQQRRANNELAQKTVTQKRAQRRAYTREKAERRRAMRAASQ